MKLNLLKPIKIKLNKHIESSKLIIKIITKVS